MENNNKVYLTFYQTVKSINGKYFSEIRCFISKNKFQDSWFVNRVKQKKIYFIYKYRILCLDHTSIIRKIYNLITKNLMAFRYGLKTKNLTAKMIERIDVLVKSMASRIMRGYFSDYYIGRYFYHSKKLSLI